MQELERADGVETRHWGRRAFVFAWMAALGLGAAGAALRWRAIMDELTRTPTATRTSGEATSRREPAR